MKFIGIYFLVLCGLIGDLSAQNCEALLVAVKNENATEVERMLNTVDPNCSCDDTLQPRTPLGMAVTKGNLKIVKQLVNSGAKVN